MRGHTNRPLTADDWLWWALAVPLPEPPRTIGRHALRLVLVALAAHAGPDCLSWPAAQTLADAVAGLSRRDVRNALEVLEEGAIIARAGRKGRATCWRLGSFPAGDNPSEVAGYPASTSARQLAGEVAGEVAGQVAGYPAANRTEQKNTPLPPSPDHHPRKLLELAGILRTMYPGMSQDVALKVAGRCEADPATSSAAARLRQQAYVTQVLADLKAEEDAERRRMLATAPKCEDHPTYAASHCNGCMGDANAGQRDRRFMGRHQPRCTRCSEPVIGQPEGATLCGEHARTAGQGAA